MSKKTSKSKKKTAAEKSTAKVKASLATEDQENPWQDADLQDLENIHDLSFSTDTETDTDTVVEADEESEEAMAAAAVGSELENFESAEVEDLAAMTDEEVQSVVESLLFSTEKPMTAAAMKAAFAGSGVKVADIRKALQSLEIEYSGSHRGVVLEEVAGGYQLRTKPENMKYLRQTQKARPFRLSGPALEVLSIVAYKQPSTKSMVDEIRGVESGHLMRGLLERGIIRFAGKSDLPGRPMLYETTRKFLEIFGLRNINELPSLNEIEQIIPEGIDETDDQKETLTDLTGRLSEKVGQTYSEGEEELAKISDELSGITTSSEFFEQEKRRMKEKAEADRAQDIQEKLMVGEDVSVRDRNWLERYQAAQLQESTEAKSTTVDTDVAEVEKTNSDGSIEV